MRDLDDKLDTFFKQGQSVSDEEKNLAKVFIVYSLKQSSLVKVLTNQLKKWSFIPVTLDQEPNKGQMIWEKLNRELGRSSFGLVLATADQEVTIKDSTNETKTEYWTRPNVMIELGILKTLLPNDVQILKDKQVTLPSDVNALVFEEFELDDISENFSDDTLRKLLNELYKLYHLYDN